MVEKLNKLFGFGVDGCEPVFAARQLLQGDAKLSDSEGVGVEGHSLSTGCLQNSLFSLRIMEAGRQ